MSLLSYVREFPRRQHVRPWALAGPVLVLVVTLPLLRPLRAPYPSGLSDQELSCLATVEALVEHKTLAIEGTTLFPILLAREPNDAAAPRANMTRVAGSYYSNQPPAMAVLLAGPYWLMWRWGVSFHSNPVPALYILTLLGSSLPVAAAAGLMYRMGRLFELPRRWRSALGVAAVFSTGLVSYAVALNSHAPAAVLLLAACACLIHVAASRKPGRMGAWLMVAGLCAALAAAIDLAAMVFLVGLAAVILAMRWPVVLRVSGVLAYLIGAVPPVLLHVVLSVSVTQGAAAEFPLRTAPAALRATPVVRDEEAPPEPGWFHGAAESAEKVFWVLFGPRGLLSHFPVLVLGVAGIALALRSHWPATTRTMACVTLGGAAALVSAFLFLGADWSRPMFGPRWFIVFTPLLLFWAGPWLRKKHRPAAWTCAAVLLCWSVAVSLIGLSDPFVAAPLNQFTPVAAIKRILHAEPALPPVYDGSH